MTTLDWIVLGLFCLALVGVIVWVLKKKDKDTPRITSLPEGMPHGWQSVLPFSLPISVLNIWLALQGQVLRAEWPWLTGRCTVG